MIVVGVFIALLIPIAPISVKGLWKSSIKIKHFQKRYDADLRLTMRATNEQN